MMTALFLIMLPSLVTRDTADITSARKDTRPEVVVPLPPCRRSYTARRERRGDVL
jgi:hypothetical protein